VTRTLLLSYNMICVWRKPLAKGRPGVERWLDERATKSRSCWLTSRDIPLSENLTRFPDVFDWLSMIDNNPRLVSQTQEGLFVYATPS
jgi:hypothetical protein